jgi:hypothetical protein
LQVLLSQLRDPAALVARLQEAWGIQLTDFLEILPLLHQEPFDAKAVADALIAKHTDLIQRLLDPNDWEFVKNRVEGICVVPLAVTGDRRKAEGVKPARRNGPREYILATQKELAAKQGSPGKLDVRTNVLVTRVLFKDNDPTNTAIGVAYLQGDAAKDERFYGADPNAPDEKSRPKWEELKKREQEAGR